MINESVSYDHDFSHDNVYGHALSLIKEYQDAQGKAASGRIHLDVGCGYGRIAEHLTEQTSLSYVGLDAEAAGLESLRQRGFEAHRYELSSNKEKMLEDIAKVIGERRVASISMLDVLEHLPEGDAVLELLAELAHAHGAVLVLSVPNVAHADIGYKLATGFWAYTDQGLLDHTHTRLFNRTYFHSVLRARGLHIIREYDVRHRVSDQRFPSDHPALSSGTSLNQLFEYVRGGVDDTADVMQFVVACLPGPAGRTALRPAYDQEVRPFLTVVTRTTGNRIQALEECLLCLTAQTQQDFEVLIVGHNLDAARQIEVETLIETLPAEFRSRVRLIRVEGGGRTAPLNKGFSAARGRYIAILDDDDLVMANWVAEYEALAKKHPGKLLRCVSASQKFEIVDFDGHSATRASSSFSPFAEEFDLIKHLEMNHSPNCGVAFPRSVFQDLNIQFDDSLTTTEDWDYILRVALLVGVANYPGITSIYRWWVTADSSRTQHDEDEWENNHKAIYAKLDRIPIVLPAGSVRLLRRLNHRPSPHVEPAKHTICDTPNIDAEKSTRLIQLYQLLESTSWRISAPIRWVGRFSGRPRPIRASESIHLSCSELDAAIASIHNSRSWRMTTPLRAYRLRKAAG